MRKKKQQKGLRWIAAVGMWAVIIGAGISSANTFSAKAKVTMECGHTGYDDNGFCTGEDCTNYEPAFLNEENVYEIGNAGQLYWFASQINDISAEYYNECRTGDVILTNDIILNENLLTEKITVEEDGTVIIKETPRSWTPIGANTGRFVNGYEGTFDGNNYVIRGMYIDADSSGQDIGLFGYVEEGGIVQNLGIEDSCVYIKANYGSYSIVTKTIGSIVGHLRGTL